MINQTALPKISEILSRLGIEPGGHKRTGCPIHRGDNKQAFSYDDSKGQWFCFRCGFGGDGITLIEKALDTDFKGALRWLGLEPGKPPAPDLRQRARVGLKAWAKQTGKEFRDEFLARERVITRARARLRHDPEDAWAWNWLGWALTGHAAIEYKLDLLIGKEADQVEAYKTMRSSA